MRRARVFVSRVYAGDLSQQERGRFVFTYASDYSGTPVSLTMPVATKHFEYEGFPPFFDGLLPEGNRLERLLKVAKLDATDYLGQLLAVGEDLVGNVTVTP